MSIFIYNICIYIYIYPYIYICIYIYIFIVCSLKNQLVAPTGCLPLFSWDLGPVNQGFQFHRLLLKEAGHSWVLSEHVGNTPKYNGLTVNHNLPHSGSQWCEISPIYTDLKPCCWLYTHVYNVYCQMSWFIVVFLINGYCALSDSVSLNPRVHFHMFPPKNGDTPFPGPFHGQRPFL